MHNAWILGKSDLTIDLPSDYFVEPKFLFVFRSTLQLKDICPGFLANDFDFYSFLFVTLYLLVDDHFLFNLFQTSGSLDFKLNGSLLLCLYALLTWSYNLPNTLIWFESRFPFYNTNFVRSIVHYRYHIFCSRFLNFERHNERYQEHFLIIFLAVVIAVIDATFALNMMLSIMKISIRGCFVCLHLRHLLTILFLLLWIRILI